MIHPTLGVDVAVTSHARPHNVAKIQEVLGCEVSFYVIDGEQDDYLMAGAKSVYACPPGISAARNKAMEVAFAAGVPSVQVSDDLKKIERIELVEGKRKFFPATFEEVVIKMHSGLVFNHYYYGGVAVSNNPLNYTGEDVSWDKLIVCDLNMFMPGCIRFDEGLPQKEDYDMTIRQLIEVGGVVRLNNYLCDFPHRNNQGGANTYRNDETEEAAMKLLADKWPGLVKKHKTRDHQVSLDSKAIEQYRKGQSKQLF